jgi:uncharacterized phage protein (TIGR02220 family)
VHESNQQASLATDTPTETTKPRQRAIPFAVEASEILDHLNQTAGSKYRPVEANLKPIRERLKEVEGDVDGVKVMITRQNKKWRGTEMATYLRVSTLFNKTKFHDYYGSRELPIEPGPKSPDRALSKRDEYVSGRDAVAASLVDHARKSLEYQESGALPFG